MNVPYPHMHAFIDDISYDLVASETNYPASSIWEGITDQWKLDLIALGLAKHSGEFIPPELPVVVVFEQDTTWEVQDINVCPAKKEVTVKMKRPFAFLKGSAMKELNKGDKHE